MALIGTLRDKMGTLLVVLVFLAIIAFILNDLLGNNSILFNSNSVGKIGGTNITREDYQAAIAEQETKFALEYGRRPTERDMNLLRNHAWELLVVRHAMEKEFKKAGVEVTTDELWDMVQGKNVDEQIRQSFTNPQTGEFDRDRVVEYLQAFNSPPPTDPQANAIWQEQRLRWELHQRSLTPSRLRLKYENLLLKSTYVTNAEAEREYHGQTDVAEVKYLYIPYYAASDITEASEDDIKQYYKENKERFKIRNRTRSLKYVRFPVLPSDLDTLDIQNEMKRIANELAQTNDDSAYAVANSDNPNAFRKYYAGNLPSYVSRDDLREGNVIGPFLDGDVYRVIKVSKVFKDTVFSARAKHILIKPDDETPAAKNAAKEKARKILKEIRDGADFAAKALEHGTDGTRTNGGDLGWFTSGQMVKPFEDAVFKATRPGLLSDVVETQFGYHIIEVTNTKDNSAVNLAEVEIPITPSDATTNDVYRKAEAFLSGVSNEKEFIDKAGKEGLTVLEGKNITSNDMRIGILDDSREIVRWLFLDGSVGKVSNIFDLHGEFVVAVMTDEREDGYLPLEAVRDEIAAEALQKAQGRAIIAKLAGLNGTLEEIAQAYGTDANVYSSSSLKLNSNSLPSAGFDPTAVGIAFSLNDGERSKPYAGENGVFIFEMQHKTIAPAIADYSSYKAPIQLVVRNRSSFNIGEAIKEYAGIVDERYKVY